MNCDDPPGELVTDDALEDGAEDGVAVGGLQEASKVQVDVIHRLVHPGDDDGHIVMVTMRVTVIVTMTVTVRVMVKATVAVTVLMTVTVKVTVTARYLFIVSICLGSMELLKSAQLLAFLPVQISLGGKITKYITIRYNIIQNYTYIQYNIHYDTIQYRMQNTSVYKACAS